MALKFSDFTTLSNPTSSILYAVLDPTDTSMAPTGTDKKISDANAIYSPATIVVAPSSSSHRADYYTDGIADDVQIQAALDAINTAGGGVLLVRAGSYSISTLIKIHSNTIFQGEGYATQLNLANGVNTNLMRNYDLTGNSNIILRSFYVNGNRTNQTGDGNSDIINILFDGVTYGFIENVWTDNGFRAGIDVRSSTSVHVQRCIATNCGPNGIQLGDSNAAHPLAGSQKCSVSFCTVINTGSLTIGEGMGIGIYYSHDCEVSDNFIDGTVESCITIWSNSATTMCYRNIVSRNTCLNAGNFGSATGTHGISSQDGAKETYISDNSIYNPKAFGIYTDSGTNIATTGDDVVVHNNKIFNPGSRGLDLKVGQRIQATNNKIYTPGFTGIRMLSTGTNHKIESNSVYNGAEQGMQINPTSGCSISNNIVINSVSDGIRLLGVSYSTIEGNTFSSNGNTGIHFFDDASANGCVYNVVTGNICTLNTSGGIVEVAGHPNNNIYTSNNCHGNLASNFVTIGANDVIANNITT